MDLASSTLSTVGTAAFAHGMHGGHMAFGLGFLNLVGHVLFLILVFWLVKNFIFAMRGEPMSGFGPSSNWRSRKEAWKSRHHDGHAQHTSQPKVKFDDAMTTARQRLADGEITAEDFDAIKQGLEGNGSNSSDPAIKTARMRLAKSEITADEFESVKKALLGTVKESTSTQEEA